VGSVSLNLLALAYFKYLGFFVFTANAALQTQMAIPQIVLPLAISFFTFQQIAFLYDVYQNKMDHVDSLSYSLFITFFPQLIAGPIVHHREMMPQFLKRKDFKLHAKYLEYGLTFFAIGLFKKLCLADPLAPYANVVFDAAHQNISLSFFESWAGALAYTVQLYFDFSGYADMAIGTAWLFGIELPMNFNSPYRCLNISEFWRAWHITLGRFLRECLYIPLGGNRQSSIRTLRNLIITMGLAGLWHGAGWTFVLWGIAHGLFLVVHQIWLKWTTPILNTLRQTSRMYRLASWLFTFMSVVLAWVLFRANTVQDALNIYQGMLGMNGVLWPQKFQFITTLPFMQKAQCFDYAGLGVFGSLWGGVWIMIGLTIAFFLPNTKNYITGESKYLVFQPSWLVATFIAGLFFVSFKLILWFPSQEFLYFNF